MVYICNRMCRADMILILIQGIRGFRAHCSCSSGAGIEGGSTSEASPPHIPQYLCICISVSVYLYLCVCSSGVVWEAEPARLHPNPLDSVSTGSHSHRRLPYWKGFAATVIRLETCHLLREFVSYLFCDWEWSTCSLFRMDLRILVPLFLGDSHLLNIYWNNFATWYWETNKNICTKYRFLGDLSWFKDFSILSSPMKFYNYFTSENRFILQCSGSCLAVDQTVMELRRVNNNLEGIKSLLTVSFDK